MEEIIYLENLGIEEVKRTKSISTGLLRESTTDKKVLLKLLLIILSGGSLDLQTGKLNPPQFGTVSPYQKFRCRF